MYKNHDNGRQKILYYMHFKKSDSKLQKRRRLLHTISF